MTLLQMELSQLEVEPLEILVDVPTPEQNSDLETLTSSKAEVDLIGVLTVKGTLPFNSHCTGSADDDSDSVCCCCGGGCGDSS